MFAIKCLSVFGVTDRVVNPELRWRLMLKSYQYRVRVFEGTSTSMTRNRRLLLLGVSLLVANPTMACEPVVPFMQVMVPAIALSGSILVLVVAVVLKSMLFAVFERRLPRLRAAWRMFLGNVLTSFVGLLVALMIASSPGIWLIGVPLVYLLCWLPSRRLVKAAPLA